MQRGRRRGPNREAPRRMTGPLGESRRQCRGSVPTERMPREEPEYQCVDGRPDRLHQIQGQRVSGFGVGMQEAQHRIEPRREDRRASPILSMAGLRGVRP